MQRLHAADSPAVLERFHEHLYLVDISAKQMIRALRWRVDLEELVSAGREGLWEAARRYDPDSSVPFKGFAGYRVRGAMIDHVRRMAAVPRRAYERLAAVEAALLVSEGLSERRLSEPRMSEPRMSEPRMSEPRMSEPRMSEPRMSERAREPEEAAEAVVDEHLASMVLAQAVQLAPGQADIVEAQATPEEAYEHAELRAAVRVAVDCLRPAQAEVIRRFYFERQDFGQIAGALNMSKSWVSRTHARAITRLSVRLRELAEDDLP